MTTLVGKMEFITRLKYMRDVIRGLDFIHKKSIIHRDIKTSNILITKTGAKIFDFGLGKIMESTSLVPKKTGTRCYFAPEVIFRT
jgi:serine/threonine protein kinase